MNSSLYKAIRARMKRGRIKIVKMERESRWKIGMCDSIGVEWLSHSSCLVQCTLELSV